MLERLDIVSDILPPEIAGQYEVIERLSGASASEVYLVKSRKDGKKHVAKLCQASNEASYTEARMLARLEHPGVPRLTVEAQSGNAICTVREYVEGQPLDRLPVPLERDLAVSIVSQLCDILLYLHSQTPPCIHRDIKPQNIILDSQGNIHLIDFGISRHYSESAERDTVFSGTNGFAPPEQYGFQQTDCRADIYALGALLCFLLTGHSGPDRPGGVTDKRLARIIRKCTAFSPDDRFRSVSAVKAALLGSGGNARLLLLAGMALLFLIAATAFSGSRMAPEMESPVVFQEPLIEAAVKAALRLEADDIVTQEHLSLVENLNIYGNQAFGSHEEWSSYSQKLDYGPTPNDAVVPLITSLEDLAMLPNLQAVRIRWNDIDDYQALSQLSDLQFLDICPAYEMDLSPLAGLERLADISLAEGEFSDLSPLHALPSLVNLGIWDSYVATPETLSDFGGLQSLFVNRQLYKHLPPESPLRIINLADTRIDSLEYFEPYKSTLSELVISRTDLKSLQGIEEYERLRKLHIDGTGIEDLTPLLSLPRLEEVYISLDMEAYADEIRERAEFGIYLFE